MANDKERLQKRKDLLQQVMQMGDISEKEAVKGLYDQIIALQTSKAKLEKEDVESLIAHYEKCGVAFKNNYDAAMKRGEKDKADLFHMLIKKYSKDYTALYKYMSKLDKGIEDDKKQNIDEFFEAARTKTVSIGGKSMNDLDKAGAGMSVRYIVPIKVTDEPIEGVKEGEDFYGFFTEDERYDENLSEEAVSHLEDIKISQMVRKKYTGVESALQGDENNYSNWHDIALCLNQKDPDDSDFKMEETLRLNPAYLFTRFNEDQVLDVISRRIEKAKEDKKISDEADYAAAELKKIRKKPERERKAATHALVEYCSNIIKAEFGRDVLKGIGVNYKSPVAQRNSLMSSVADVLGCSDIIAFSEKLNVKTVENGKEVVKKGTIMMPAKGEDPSGVSKNQANLSKASIENVPGLIKSISTLQFLDFICGNTDRHGKNLFYQFDKQGRLIGVQGIDNDNSFGEAEHADRRGNAIPFENLGIIPKEMADKIKTMKKENFAVLLQGYGLNAKEVENSCNRLEQLKKDLKKSEEFYKDAVPGYLDPTIPRIVPENEMELYSVNEQLAMIGEDPRKNLFGRISSWRQTANFYDVLNNQNNRIMKNARELDEALLMTGEGSLDQLSKTMRSYTDALGVDGKGKPKKLKGEALKEFNALKKMTEATEALFTSEDLQNRYIMDSNLNAGSIVDGMKIYAFNGEKYVERASQVNTLHDATIEEDERYKAFNAAYEATEEYLVEHSETGITLQELQEDVKLANTPEARKAARKALKTFQDTDECKRYMTAVENKKVLGEQLDKLVSLHKDCFDIGEARNRFNEKLDEIKKNPKAGDPYKDSEMEKQAQKRVAEINKKQAEKQAKANKAMNK